MNREAFAFIEGIFFGAIIGASLALFLTSCTLTINITDTAPGLEIPADQQPPTKNM